MEQPIIAKKIKRQGNLIAGCGAFIGLGVAGISAVTLAPVATLMLCGSMIPLALDVIGLKLLIEKPDPKSIIQNTWMLDIPFRKSIDKWIVNYINDSENLTEKKYKVGCLSIWMNTQGLTLDKVSANKTYKFLSELSNELFDSKETQKEIPLAYFFGESQGAIKDIFGVEPSIKTFLNDDKDSEDKLQIAKKVYKEYSEIGLAGKAFVNRVPFQELLILQDYKFTREDYEVIEAYIKNVKQGGRMKPPHVLTTEQFSENTVNAMNKIINNEQDIKNLKTLGNYCSNIGYKNSVEQIVMIIEKKIEFLQLNSELETKDVSDKSKAKKMKV